MRSLFIFRRDLRLQDNTALLAALSESTEVLPCFIFDPEQIERHAYFSTPAFQYMIESLESLDRELKLQGARLHVFQGKPEDIVGRLIAEAQVQSVYVNRDYTPFSEKRDSMLYVLCKQRGVSFRSHHDALLTVPGEVLNKSGEPFKVYTHFAREARAIAVGAPKNSVQGSWSNVELAFESEPNILQSILRERSELPAVRGGREVALEQLKKASQLGNYGVDRNMPALFATTRLSACNKFGVLSIREVYHAVRDAHGEDHALIGELYWRDFFTHLAFHFPRVFEGPFDLRYRNLWWENNEEKFEAFCKGETGYPIVDAGIRELLQTGYMHNRVRMIVASFLVKDLHIDWRLGERFFAQNLIDYDPCVNNGNWQWSASTGADAAPYFRIFNPWTQQLRFDPEGEYIRRWVDELRGLDPEELYALSLPDSPRPKAYAAPIIDHKRESAKTKAIYQSALAASKAHDPGS